MKPRLLTILLFSAGFWLTNGGGRAAAAEIELKESAQISAPVVLLGDVAEIRDADPAVVRRLQSIVLGPAPANRSQIPLAQVRSMLQSRGENLAQITFTGRSIVTVSPVKEPARRSSPTTDHQKEQARALVQQAVRGYLQGRVFDLDRYVIEVELPDDAADGLLSSAGDGLQVIGGHPPGVRAQPMVFQYESPIEGRRRLQAMVRLAPLPMVAAARYTVPRGHVLQAADLFLKPAETTGGGGEGAITRLEEAIGKEAARTLRKNEPIRREHLRTVPLVRRNDIVSVSSRIGGITVQRNMKSRGEGAIGDPVTLVSLDGRRTVLATVTGFHEAETIGSQGAGVEDSPPLSQQPIPQPLPRRPRYARENFEVFAPVPTSPEQSQPAVRRYAAEPLPRRY